MSTALRSTVSHREQQVCSTDSVLCSMISSGRSRIARASKSWGSSVPAITSRSRQQSAEGGANERSRAGPAGFGSQLSLRLSTVHRRVAPLAQPLESLPRPPRRGGRTHLE